MATTGMQVQKQSPPAARVVTPEELFDHVREIYHSIARRAFEIFEGNGSGFGRALEDWFQAEAELLHPVHLEVAESGEGFTLRAEVPGFKAGELEISLEENRLTIAGRRETKKDETKGQRIICASWCSDQILRVVDLPTAVDAAKVKAVLEDGILRLEMPKAATAAGLAIETNAA